MIQQEINSTSMLKVGTILHGTYRIDSYLSSGGFGNTYVATNIEFEERVAIKEFFMKGVTQRDDNQTTVSVSNTENHNSFLEQKEKFKKEARRIRQLKNEHIVSVHDLFEENGTAYYVMDFVDGENLAHRMKRTGKPMSEKKVREILSQILDALKAVHDTGIWHLDLKPANIMLDKDGNVKLIDFGASKQLNAQKGGATTSTAITYTSGYAPREQMEQNYDKFGPWTDIYALGATLYYLLTNKRPPLPTDIDDDISEDKHNALPFPESVGEMKYLVLQMMKTNRLQRPQSIDALVEAEKTMKRTHQQAPKQQSTPKPAADNEDEETIIAGSKPKQGEEKTEPKPGPKVYSQPTQSSNIHASQVSEDSTNFPWGVLLLIIFGLFLLFVILPKNCSNNSSIGNQTTTQSSSPKTVEKMGWNSPIGYCEYSGPIDEQGIPHGLGKANFSDGRYYRGNFEHGELTGDNCYFMYSNGDIFDGKFRNNAFYFGRYTIAKDRSYYEGYYEKGQPSGGTWYDKNGNVIQ